MACSSSMAFEPPGLIGLDSTDDMAEESTTSTGPPLGVVGLGSNDSNSPRSMAQSIRHLDPVAVDSECPTAQRPEIDWTMFSVGPPLGLIGLDGDSGDNPYNGIRQRNSSLFAPTTLLEDKPNANVSNLEHPNPPQ